jgi:hypothetical protein
MDMAVSDMAKELLDRDLTESEESYTHKTVEKQVVDDIDRMLSGAGFTKVGTGRWSSSDTDVSIHAEDHPQTGKRLIHKAEMVNDEGTTVGNISLPPIQIETSQYLQILHSLKDFIGSRVMGQTESIEIIEGRRDQLQDTDKAVEIVKRMTPARSHSRGFSTVIKEAGHVSILMHGFNAKKHKAEYVVTLKKNGEKWDVLVAQDNEDPRKIPGGRTPVQSARRAARALERIYMGEGVEDVFGEASGYPSVGSIVPIAGPPQTGSAGRYGNPQTGERVGLSVSKQKSTEGESLYPVEVTTIPKVATPPQSGPGGRYGNEAQKLREVVLGKGGSKVKINMTYPNVSGANAETPPPESASPGEAAVAPCGCDFDDKTDMAGGGGKTKMGYPTVS